MLRIRLLRVGKKNSPSFRVVVTPRRTAPKTGRFLEILGSHNPLRHERVLKGERIKYWLSQGAQPSARVQNMLISEGIMEGEKATAHKSAKKKEEVEGAAEEAKEIAEIKEEEVKAAPEGDEPRSDKSEREGETEETKEESPATGEEKPAEEEASVEEETPTEETKETSATAEGGEETPASESGEEKKKEPATEE